jgi:hypothetical protein
VQHVRERQARYDVSEELAEAGTAS